MGKSLALTALLCVGTALVGFACRPLVENQGPPKGMPEGKAIEDGKAPGHPGTLRLQRLEIEDEAGRLQCIIIGEKGASYIIVNVEGRATKLSLPGLARRIADARRGEDIRLAALVDKALQKIEAEAEVERSLRQAEDERERLTKFGAPKIPPAEKD